MKQQNNIVVEIDGVKVSVTAPYCTAAEWADRIGLTADDVNSQLRKGGIAKHQQVARGRLYVNVIAEIRKTITGVHA